MGWKEYLRGEEGWLPGDQSGIKETIGNVVDYGKDYLAGNQGIIPGDQSGIKETVNSVLDYMPGGDYVRGREGYIPDMFTGGTPTKEALGNAWDALPEVSKWLNPLTMPYQAANTAFDWLNPAGNQNQPGQPPGGTPNTRDMNWWRKNIDPSNPEQNVSCSNAPTKGFNPVSTLMPGMIPCFVSLSTILSPSTCF